MEERGNNNEIEPTHLNLGSTLKGINPAMFIKTTELLKRKGARFLMSNMYHVVLNSQHENREKKISEIFFD